MPEPDHQFKRQVAYKIRILDILNSNFSKDENSAGQILLSDFTVSRVNLIATLVYKSDEGAYATAIIDDGTGKISLKSFEGKNAFLRIDVGDIVLCIGKIREFNGERYIYPEILKKLDNIEWLTLRKLELKNFPSAIKKMDENKEGANEMGQPNIFRQIFGLVKDLDKGDGVPIEEVIKNSQNSDAEIIINKLLENGDVFEVRPGRLKVLE